MQPMLLYPRRSRFAPKFEVGKEDMKKINYGLNLRNRSLKVKGIKLGDGYADTYLEI